MGIPYLWVDATCIIQDDDQDWEEQSSKIREVYLSCSVALAAEDTADCGLGFLPRVLPQARGVTLNPCSHDQMLRFWSDDWTGVYSENALSARGWTLQEQILPSRKLWFKSSNMVWECNEVLEAPNGVGDMGLLSLTFWAYRLAISGRKDKRPPRGVDAITDEDEDGEDIRHQNITNFLISGSANAMYYAWYTIAEYYSTRALTEPTDKLSALSGLASLFASSIPTGPDDYLAGIWRHNLAEGLLWHAAEP